MKKCEFTQVVFMDVSGGTSIDEAAKELEAFCQDNNEVSIMTKFNGARLLIEYDRNPARMREQLVFSYDYWLKNRAHDHD